MMKRIFDFYINSSIHVALAAYALAWVTLKEFNLNYDEATLYVVFWGTITGYNFVKYYGITKWYFRRLTTYLKIIQVFFVICFLLLFYYVVQLNTDSLLILAVSGSVTFLYAIPLLSKYSKLENLRQINGLKIYIIALVWTCVTVMLPLVNANCNLDYNVFIVAVQRFIYIIVLMIPFEIRDLELDNSQLGTLPQKIGSKVAKLLGIVLVVFFFLTEFLKVSIRPDQVFIVFTISLITILFVVFSKVKQSKYYASFWVESLPIVWLLLWLLF